jgi:hypothetical protein
MNESDGLSDWPAVQRRARSAKSADLRRLALVVALTITVVFVIAVAISVPAARSAECRNARHSFWPRGEPSREMPADRFWAAREQHAAILERCKTYDGLSVEAVLDELGKPSWNSQSAISGSREVGYDTGVDYLGDAEALFFTYDVESRTVLVTGSTEAD